MLQITCRWITLWLYHGFCAIQSIWSECSLCNKAASSAFPEPTNYVIDLIQPTTVMLNQISKEGIKCKKCGKKKIGDGSYYPSNWNQPMSRDQLSKNHFKWIREGWLTSLLRITMLCFSTKVINWQLHFILLHAGPIACRQLLHHLHSMLNTACQQNRSDTFFVHTCSV